MPKSKGKNVDTVTFTCPYGFIEEFDAEWRENKFTSRSAALHDAMRMFIEEQRRWRAMRKTKE